MIRKIAIPTADNTLCMHFGHCETFTVVNVDDNNAVTSIESLLPPPHEPGLLPRWLAKHGVTDIIAGGMGQRAQALFAEQKIIVTTGAPAESPETLVKAYLEGSLETGSNACDH